MIGWVDILARVAATVGMTAVLVLLICVVWGHR